MIVNVKQTCGRCRKTKTVELPFEEVQKLVAEQSANEDAVNEFITEVGVQLDNSEAKMPELIVFAREDDGTYTANTLDDLCAVDVADGDSDAKRRNRGCKSRVTSLLKDIFEMGAKPVTPRKRKTKKESSEDNSPEKEE